jgi:hypothetical protein
MNWKCGNEQVGTLVTLPSWIFEAPDSNVGPDVSYPEVLWGSVQYVQTNVRIIQVYKLSSAILKFRNYWRPKISTHGTHDAGVWRQLSSLLSVTSVSAARWFFYGEKTKRKHLSLSIAQKVESLRKLGHGLSVKCLTEEYGVTTTTILPYYISKIRKILNSETHLALKFRIRDCEPLILSQGSEYSDALTASFNKSINKPLPLVWPLIQILITMEITCLPQM